MALGAFGGEQRLPAAARYGAPKLGLGLAPACDQMVENLIRNGVQRMQFSQALEQEDKIHLAERNLHRFIVYMRDKAMEFGTYPVLTEKAFEAAMKGVCPVWPYC